jgi:hypothetical protein
MNELALTSDLFAALFTTLFIGKLMLWDSGLIRRRPEFEPRIDKRSLLGQQVAKLRPAV